MFFSEEEFAKVLLDKRNQMIWGEGEKQYGVWRNRK